MTGYQTLTCSASSLAPIFPHLFINSHLAVRKSLQIFTFVYIFLMINNNEHFNHTCWPLLFTKKSVVWSLVHSLNLLNYLDIESIKFLHPFPRGPCQINGLQKFSFSPWYLFTPLWFVMCGSFLVWVCFVLFFIVHLLLWGHLTLCKTQCCGIFTSCLFE